VKPAWLVFFRICRASLAGICLFPLIGHCQIVGVAQDSAPALLQSIAVTPRVSSIVTGATQQFTAIGTYSDGRKKNITSSVTWDSSAKNVATITSGGLATGVAAGRSKINATLLSIRGTASLTVTPALVAIAVTPNGATIIVGNSQQFTATGTFSDGSTKDITASVVWSSSATNIVTISNTGLANALIGGVAPGGPPAQVTIAATLGSVNGSTTLTVTDNLTSIALSPSSITLTVGAQQTFTATGSYQDGTSSDVTSLALWSSSNTTVLTIVANGSGAGTATAVAIGAATVTAAENGINGTATVTVTKAPPPPGAITPSFFGMTIGDTAPYPPSTVPIGAIGHPTLLAWATIEPDRGVYKFDFYDKFADWARVNNVPFMVTFGWTPTWASSKCVKGKICPYPPDNLQDWIDFITAVVNHYNGGDKPNIQYYELWNEANDQTFWMGKLDQLVALAQAAYPIIHQNPVSQLLTPSTSGSRIDAHDWMIAYLQAGGAQYADGGTFHGYLAPQGGSPPYPFPEDSDISGYGDIVTRAATFRLLYDIFGLQGKPMFDTEGSWGKAQIPDPNQQAAWLARWYLLQAGAGTTQSAYWLAWGNSSPQKPIDQQWGLISDYYDQTTPTTAGIAYGQVYNWLVDAAISPCTSSANVWTCALIRSGKNYKGLAVWFYSANESDTTSYTPDPQFVQYRDLAGNVTSVTGAITIGPQPVLLESGPPP